MTRIGTHIKHNAVGYLSVTYHSNQRVWIVKRDGKELHRTDQHSKAVEWAQVYVNTHPLDKEITR